MKGYYHKARNEFRKLGGRFFIGEEGVCLQVLVGNRLIKCVSLDSDLQFRLDDVLHTALSFMENMTKKQLEKFKEY